MADISVIRIAPEINGQDYGVVLYPPALATTFTPDSLQPAPLTLLATQESYLKLTLVFSADILPLEAPYNNPVQWVFSGPGSAVTATTVSVAGPVLTIYHSEPTDGSSYNLAIPAAAIKTSGRPISIPSFTSFTGLGYKPIVYAATPIDATHVTIQFSEPVNSTDALTTTNYTITPTLAVVDVVQNNPSNYTLEVAEQTPETQYTIDVENVRDLLNNEIPYPPTLPVYFLGFGAIPDSQPSALPVIPPAVNLRPGVNILPNQPITFNITDDEGFRDLYVMVSFPLLGITDVVHNGTEFLAHYSNPSNTRVPIPFGYQYTILRDGGWTSELSLVTYVVDLDGQSPAP